MITIFNLYVNDTSHIWTTFNVVEHPRDQLVPVLIEIIAQINSRSSPAPLSLLYKYEHTQREKKREM